MGDTTPITSNSKWKTARPNTKLALLHSPTYTQILNVMKSVHENRDLLLDELYEFFEFLNGGKSNIPYLDVVEPRVATYTHLLKFHTEEYLDILSSCAKERNQEVLDQYGLSDENSTLYNHDSIWKYCQSVAGASLHASNLLKEYNIAINWGGGRHHAHPSTASGFCFINDIALSILNLLEYYTKIVYIDIDIHHGDGVQDAFYNDPNVVCISFHRYAPGFFPNSGGIEYKGEQMGLGYNLNIPLPCQCTDDDFITMFEYTLENIQEVYNPNAIVLCCGCDGLHNDPLVSQVDAGWRLTPHGIQHVVHTTAQSCIDNHMKLLVLGGGGYNPSQTALTYFLCTAAICQVIQPDFELPEELPQELVGTFGNITKEYSKRSNLCQSWMEKEEYESILNKSKGAVELCKEFIKSKELEYSKRQYVCLDDKVEDDWEKDCFSLKKKKKVK